MKFNYLMSTNAVCFYGHVEYFVCGILSNTGKFLSFNGHKMIPVYESIESKEYIFEASTSMLKIVTSVVLL